MPFVRVDRHVASLTFFTRKLGRGFYPDAAIIQIHIDNHVPAKKLSHELA
jgi:hypothetical protein